MRNFSNFSINNIFENSIIIENIFAFLIPCFILFGINSYTSLFFSITFAISFIIIFFYFSKIDFDIILFLIILLSFLSVYIDLKLNHLNNIDFSYYDKLLFFINTLIVFKITSIIKLKKFYVNLLMCFFYLLGVLFIISYYIFHNTATNAGGLGNILTMGFQNPNFTAMWISQCVYFQIIYFFNTKKILLKIISCVIISLLIVLILKTSCRSVLVTLFFYLLFLMHGFKSKKYKFNNITLLIITLVPLLFCFLYMFLLKTEWFYNVFSFLTSEGKELTSRAGMTYIFDVLSPFTLIGYYSTITGGTGQGGALNICLDIWFSYGFIVLCLFSFYIYKILQIINNQINNRFQYLCFCAFITCIINGCFEPSLVSGCTGINCIISIFISLAISNYEKNNE